MAKRREDWNGALALWEQCVGSEIAKGDTGWLNGRAVTLLRVWRIEDAIAAWKQIIEEFPDYAPAYVARANAVQELGLWATGAQHWAEIRDRFADRERPEWIANLARCLVQSNDPATELVIADLEARFPNSPLGRRIQLERAQILNFSFNARIALIEEAVRRHPADPVLLMHFLRVLLAQGRREEAISIADKMTGSANGNSALISRLRIMRDEGGNAAIRDELNSAITTRLWTLPEASSIGCFPSRNKDRLGD